MVATHPRAVTVEKLQGRVSSFSRVGGCAYSSGGFVYLVPPSDLALESVLVLPTVLVLHSVLFVFT
jgi:hypothetical protein